jgi:hypothetical protein
MYLIRCTLNFGAERANICAAPTSRFSHSGGTRPRSEAQRAAEARANNKKSYANALLKEQVKIALLESEIWSAISEQFRVALEKWPTFRKGTISPQDLGSAEIAIAAAILIE